MFNFATLAYIEKEMHFLVGVSLLKFYRKVNLIILPFSASFFFPKRYSKKL